MPKRVVRYALAHYAQFAIPLALICLIPSVVGISCANNAANKAQRLAEQNAQIRKEATRAARLTDIKICQAVNTITKRDRASIKAGPKNAIPILRKLGYTDAQIEAYRDAAQQSADDEIRRRPLIEGGNCQKLPNPVAVSTPKKKP